DGIRDFHVTGVQTCALPIFAAFDQELVLFAVRRESAPAVVEQDVLGVEGDAAGCLLPILRMVFANLERRRPGLFSSYCAGASFQIGRASCRERVGVGAVGVW